jgi:tryptophan-rich sensory protein
MIDRRVAALLVPYIAWVGFVALLNYQFLRLN